jgi:WD40 repeat protein
VGSGTGRERALLHGPTYPVHTLAFAPDGQTLAALDADCGLHLWDPAAALPRGRRAGVLALSRDGRTSAVREPTVTLRDATTGQPTARLGLQANRVTRLVFSPDGRMLASVGSDQAVHLWDAGSGQLLCTLADHPEPVRGVAFSPDGRLLATAGQDCVVYLWDTTTGHLKGSFRGAPPGGHDRCLLGGWKDGRVRQLRQDGAAVAHATRTVLLGRLHADLERLLADGSLDSSD